MQRHTSLGLRSARNMMRSIRRWRTSNLPMWVLLMVDQAGKPYVKRGRMYDL